MYSRSIAQKINLLTILFDNACLDIEEYSAFGGEYMEALVDEAKIRRDQFRRRLLFYHLRTIKN